MSRDEAEALGRRALAAGFVWAPRCLDGADGATYLGDNIWGPSDEDNLDLTQPGIPGDPSEWPDFRDAATVGVLYAQVEERAGGEVLSYACVDSAEGILWHVLVYKGGTWHRLATCEKTRVAALVAALEVGR